MCCSAWGHISTSLHLGLGFHNLRWQDSNLGCCPHSLYTSTNTPYLTISLLGSDRQSWKWACWDRWSVDHPWKWDSLVGIEVGLGVVPLLFCLCHCCFCCCYLCEQLAKLFHASAVLSLRETNPFNVLVSSTPPL
jgi:hypothetical protein